MDRLQHIYDVIAKDGFSDEALQEIDKYIKEIQNGREDFFRFNLSEHGGLCKGGAPLIGASITHATRQQALQQVEMLKAAKASMKMIP